MQNVISADNPQEIFALADALQANSFPDVMADAMPAIRDGVEYNFATASGPSKDGPTIPWAPRVDRKPHPLLILSSTMLGGAAWNGTGSVRVIDGSSIFWGIDVKAVEYARAQHFGHLYRVGGRSWYLPARPYMGLQDEHCVRVQAVLQESLIGKFRELLK